MTAPVPGSGPGDNRPPGHPPAPPPPSDFAVLEVIDAQLIALLALAHLGPAEQGTAAGVEQACAAEVLLFRLKAARLAVRDLRAAYDVPAGGRARDGRAVGADGAATDFFPSGRGRAGGVATAPGAVSEPFSLPRTPPPWVEPRRRALLPVLGDEPPRPGQPGPPPPPTPYPPPGVGPLYDALPTP